MSANLTFVRWHDTKDGQRIPIYGLAPLTKTAAAPDHVATFAESVEHFSKAMVVWARKGFPVVSKAVFIERLAICRQDKENWDERGNLGFGKCKLCGCTMGKHWLATSECPIKLWLKYEPGASKPVPGLYSTPAVNGVPAGGPSADLQFSDNVPTVRGSNQPP